MDKTRKPFTDMKTNYKLLQTGLADVDNTKHNKKGV